MEIFCADDTIDGMYMNCTCSTLCVQDVDVTLPVDEGMLMTGGVYGVQRLRHEMSDGRLFFHKWQGNCHIRFYNRGTRRMLSG